MPPILSDNESDSDNGIPFRTGPEADAPAADDEGSGEEEEYVVETVVSHEFRKGVLFFQVKWQGYDDDADLTWEPEENLETAAEVLKEYYDSIGGRPEAPSGSKKRGPKPRAKRSYSESNGTPDPAATKSRKKRTTANGEEDIVDVPRKQKDKYPPKDSSNWDDGVDACDTIEVGPINHTGGTEKFALLRWDNGQLTKTTLRMAHKYAPQAMLRFYESHLRFGPVEDATTAL